MKTISKTNLMIVLPVIFFVFSCTSSKDETLGGNYIMIKKGLYSSLNFIDEKNVIVEDNLGYNISISVPYIIRNNKVYIESKEATIIYDIKGDTLMPSLSGNGPFLDMMGVFIKERK